MTEATVVDSEVTEETVADSEVTEATVADLEVEIEVLTADVEEVTLTTTTQGTNCISILPTSSNRPLKITEKNRSLRTLSNLDT